MGNFWPKITSISLHGTTFATEGFLSFLEAHPSLEEIDMEWPDHLQINSLRSSALPRLRSVKLLTNQPVKALPFVGAGRPLERLEGYWFADERTSDGELTSPMFFDALSQCRPILKILVVARWRGRELGTSLNVLTHVPLPFLSEFHIQDYSVSFRTQHPRGRELNMQY